MKKYDYPNTSFLKIPYFHFCNNKNTLAPFKLGPEFLEVWSHLDRRSFRFSAFFLASSSDSTRIAPLTVMAFSLGGVGPSNKLDIFTEKWKLARNLICCYCFHRTCSWKLTETDRKWVKTASIASKSLLIFFHCKLLYILIIPYIFVCDYFSMIKVDWNHSKPKLDNSFQYNSPENI